MSELERFENKMISLFKEDREYTDQRFEELKGYMDHNFEEVRADIQLTHLAIQIETGKIQDKIQTLDSRVHDLEMMAQERWNVADIRDHMEVVDQVLIKHNEQIQAINEKIGIAAG